MPQFCFSFELAIAMFNVSANRPTVALTAKIFSQASRITVEVV